MGIVIVKTRPGQTFDTSPLGVKVSANLGDVMRRMGLVAMKRTTVGFAEPFYERLQEVANEHGISVSQLIREGVLFYIAYEAGLSAAVTKDASAARDGQDTLDVPAQD